MELYVLCTSYSLYPPLTLSIPPPLPGCIPSILSPFFIVCTHLFLFFFRFPLLPIAQLVVGILADKAVMSLDEGKKPIVSFQDRVKIYSNITGVAHVVCQNTLSYNFILKALKPDFVIHGSDWSQGPQVEVRKEVIEVLSTFRSRLVEVPYAKFDQIDEWITSSCQERVGSKKKE